MTKWRILGYYRFRFRDAPWIGLRFVLWDPELESHSFELDNEGELAAFLSQFLGAEKTTVAALIAEGKHDPVLSRDRGWRMSMKRHSPLGRRLAWFVATRLLRPKVVVETGVHDGLGSETLLRALQLNAADGYPGELISFDIFSDTGWAVTPELRRGWTRVIGSTFDTLQAAIRDKRIDLFIRDTPPTFECIQFELGAVLERSAERLTVIDSAGQDSIPLQTACARGNGTFRVFVDRPARHVLSENHQAFGCVRRPDADSAEITAITSESWKSMKPAMVESRL